MKRWTRILLIGSVIGSCVGCDQFTKALVQRSLEGHAPISLLGGLLRLSYAENEGAFLGLGAGLPAGVRFWVLGVMVAVAMALVAARAIADHTMGSVHIVGFAMIVGGGVGNLIDRASAGVVRDFINIGVGSIRTGIFNVADLAITIGAVVLLLSTRGRGARSRSTRS
jgi:signal peptidase II